jgi:hypothetical protein
MMRARAWGLSSLGLALAACSASDDSSGASSSAPPPRTSAPANQTPGAQSTPENEQGMTEQVIPTSSSVGYVWRFAELELVVDPRRGGRVMQYGLQGRNVLAGPEVVQDGDTVMQNNFGSTLWTSPQSDWGWPPEVAIDSAAYQDSVTGDVLTLESQPGEKMGYAVTKRIWADVARQRVSFDYRLNNVSATRPAAPWEVTRVAKRGLLFFPAASGPLEPSTLGSELVDDVAWIDIDRVPPGDAKLFQDGAEGWLAYVDDDLVLIKTFENVARSEQAPGESEIEIYVSGECRYIEIEQQGPLALPSPGAPSSWRVDWYLRRRPAEVDARLGNAELVRWVRSELGR